MDTPQVCDKEANGNRLAYDLGKSDIGTVAEKETVKFSMKVFTEDTPEADASVAIAWIVIQN